MVNISRRIFLHVAFGALLVTTGVAGATYLRILRSAEQRAIEHLQTYAIERLRREESDFLSAYLRLNTFRAMFQARDAQPIPADIAERWKAVVRRDPDGAWRTDQRLGDPSLWGHRDLEPTARQMFRYLNALDLCRELMPAWIAEFPSLYLTFPGAVCLGYNPDQLNWVWETPADYPLEDQEWHYLARPDHNPAGDFVWTSLYADPISKLPYATLLAPILVQGEFVGTIAHDMRLERLFTEATRSDFEGAQHIILRDDGRLIAHAELRDAILARDGQLTAQESGTASLSNLFALAVRDGTARGLEPISDTLFLAERFNLPGARWHFITTMPRHLAYAQAFESAKWVLLSGFALLALLLLAFATILRRQLSRPLGELSVAARAMSAGSHTAPVLSPRADELGNLAQRFREMHAQVAAREQELRSLNLALEQRVAERTRELARANRRLEEALLSEKEAGELRANFVSLVSHEFRTPLGVILTSSDILDRYLDKLSGKKRADHLRSIRDSVKRMSGMMEDVLLLGRVEAGKLQFKPAPLDLPALARRVADEASSIANQRGPVQVQFEGAFTGARGDESLLRHVFSNLLSNALKYSPDGTPITVRLARDRDHAVLTVADSGRGIPVADQQKIFQSFHRGSNVTDTPGTGLGLLIVKKCVDIHGGRIAFESREGYGTTFTVALPLFERLTP